MSLKQLIVGVLMAVCTLVTHAPAQKNEKNELSGLLGRTFISDQGIIGGTFFDNNVHFGSGLTFEANYARRVLDVGPASVSRRGSGCGRLGRTLGLRCPPDT